MPDLRRFIKNGDYYYFGDDAPVHLSGVSLDKHSISLGSVGDTAELTATIIPPDAVETPSLNWSSSNTSIATVAPYVSRLPSEYQEVEYIQSSGTQYIQTSIIPSNTKGIYMRLSSQDTATDLLYIGSRKTSDTRFWIGNSSGDNAKRVYLGWNTNDRGVISQDTIFEVKLNYLNDRKKQVDSSVIASNIGTLSSSNNVPIYIFAGNDNYSTDPSLYAPSKIKLYSCKISDGSNIVNDFVPCYRKSDNVIGLYDLVNNQFYTNSGTGTFTKGANVGGDVVVTCVTPGECNITVITNPGNYSDTCAVVNSWQPNANTLLYLPFTDDILDHSGKNHTITAQSGTNYTFTTFSTGAKCIHLNPNGGGTYFKVTPISNDVIWNWNTSATWAYKIADEQQNTGTDTWARGGCFAYNTSCHMCEISWTTASGYNSGLFKIPGGYELSGPSSTGTTYDSSDVRATSSTPHSIVFTFDATTKTMKRYLDGILFYENVFTGSLTNVPNQLCIWKGLYNSDNNRTLRGKTAHIVYELGVWDTGRIDKYVALK